MYVCQNNSGLKIVCVSHKINSFSHFNLVKVTVKDRQVLLVFESHAMTFVTKNMVFFF